MRKYWNVCTYINVRKNLLIMRKLFLNMKKILLVLVIFALSLTQVKADSLDEIGDDVDYEDELVLPLNDEL